MLFSFNITGYVKGQTYAPVNLASKEAARATINFRINSHIIDSTYRGNRKALAVMSQAANGSSSASRLDSIVVTTISSPEGSTDFNASLTELRAKAIRDYLALKNPDLNPALITTYSYPKDWKGIRETVKYYSKEMPASGELLETIDDAGLGEMEKDRKIRAMAGGSTFSYLSRNIFPYLRKGVVDFHYTPTPAVEEKPVPPVPASAPVDVAPAPAPAAVVAPAAAAVAEPAVKEPAVVPTEPDPVKPKYLFALRSNLLADVVLMPNIGIEVPLGKHFSVAGDFIYAYWRAKSDYYALQTIQGNIEARYWFRWKDKPLTGWNVGLYGVYGGRYDLQIRDGYQGDSFVSGGIVGGYSLSISQRLNLDFALAAGYVFTPEVRRYEPPQQGHLIWRETRYNKGLFSLTKARVDLVWLIGNRKH